MTGVGLQALTDAQNFSMRGELSPSQISRRLQALCR